jgi:hypothetical protein
MAARPLDAFSLGDTFQTVGLFLFHLNHFFLLVMTKKVNWLKRGRTPLETLGTGGDAAVRR